MYMSLAPNLDSYAGLDIKSRWNHPASNLIERNGQAMPGGFVPFQAGKHRILRIRPWPKVNGKTFAIWPRWIKPLRWGPCCSFGNLLLVGLSAVCLNRNATYLSNLVSKKTASLLMYYTHSHTFSKEVYHVLPWSSTCSFVVWPTSWGLNITTTELVRSPLMFGRCSTTSSWTWKILTGNRLRVRINLRDQHGKFEHNHLNLFDVKSSISSFKKSQYSCACSWKNH